MNPKSLLPLDISLSTLTVFIAVDSKFIWLYVHQTLLARDLITLSRNVLKSLPLYWISRETDIRSLHAGLIAKNFAVLAHRGDFRPWSSEK